MSTLLERVLDTNLRGTVVVEDITRLSGGIDKDIYKVPVIKNGAKQSFAVSIFKNPNDWWKIDQEIALRQMIMEDPETGIPKLTAASFDYQHGQKYAYVIRDFVEGESLANLLSQYNQQSDNRDAGILARDLGYRLAMLHRHKLSMFGMIGKPPNDINIKWGKYIFEKIDYYYRALSVTFPEKKVGKVKVADIVNTEQRLHKRLGALQSSMYDCKAASLAHGDAHFGNFIASLNAGESWRVAAVIDTEEALGADPEIDIAFIENWLHFTPYSSLFYNQKDNFILGYKSEPYNSDRYLDRRYIYHSLRSLSYLKALFTLDTEAIIRSDPKHIEYIEKHFDILKSLAEGYTLEDINIRSLI